MQTENTNAKVRTAASVVARRPLVERAVPGGRYRVRCFDKHGNLKWEDFIENLVTDVGEDELLSATLAGGAQSTNWFLGLTDAAPTVAETDTMAAHAGWAEVHTQYDEATRPVCTFGAVASQSVDNTGAPAAFSINATVTIGGAFLVNNSTKNGTTGILYSVGAFTGGDKAVDNGDTLNVEYTATMGGA